MKVAIKTIKIKLSQNPNTILKELEKAVTTG